MSLVDITVVIVAAVAIFLPARPLEGVAAAKADDGARFELAAAEARTLAIADSGAAAQDVSQRFVEAGEDDFAIEAPAVASRAAQGQPARWRPLLAVSKAYAELREVKAAYEWAQEALGACHAVGGSACPTWEEVRAELYAQHLAAGIASGIDAKKDPDGFRRAGEKGLHLVRAGGHSLTDQTPSPPPSGSLAPAPSPQGSQGSGAGSAPPR